MDQNQAGMVLALVKGNWITQPMNDPTIAVWVEILAEVDYQAAISAVKAYIATGNGEPPTPGQVAKLAVDTAARWQQQGRKLDEPQVPLTERMRNIKFVRDIAAAMGDRSRIVQVYADFKGLTRAEAEAEIFTAPGQRRIPVGGQVKHWCDQCQAVTMGPQANIYYFVCVICDTATNWHAEPPRREVGEEG